MNQEFSSVYLYVKYKYKLQSSGVPGKIPFEEFRQQITYVLVAYMQLLSNSIQKNRCPPQPCTLHSPSASFLCGLITLHIALLFGICFPNMELSAPHNSCFHLSGKQHEVGCHGYLIVLIKKCAAGCCDAHL